MSTLTFLIPILLSFQLYSLVIAIIYSEDCNILFIFTEDDNF